MKISITKNIAIHNKPDIKIKRQSYSIAGVQTEFFITQPLVNGRQGKITMILDQKLYDFFEKKARRVTVERLCMGLGYTAVSTSDGGIGIAYSYFDTKNACMMHKNYDNPEGKPAIGLVEKIFSNVPLERSMALAAVNALNFDTAGTLAEEPDNQMLLDSLGIEAGTRVAMVGAFKPLIHLIKNRGSDLTVYDIGKQVGEKGAFYEKLKEWAQVLILTSTSLLNSTTEEILGYINPDAGTVLLGPSTPLVKEIFAPLSINFLAGTVPVDKEGTFRAIRHGTGTPVIQKFGRKVSIKLN